MDWIGRRIVEKIGKRDKKAELQRAREKEEITSTEFPEGGNTIYTNRTPGIPTGRFSLKAKHGLELQIMPQIIN